MEVKVDKNGVMILKGSYIAVFLWIAIILLKIYGENEIVSARLIELNLLTTVFLVITIGAMIARRIFIYWRFFKFRENNTSKT